MNRALYCDICGAVNRSQATFCSSCGQPLFNPERDSIEGIPALTGKLQPGFLLKGRYRIIDYLGKGGFGAVYKAEDLEFGNRIVAIKEMSQSGLFPEEVPGAIETFRREALLLATLMHPNLPSIYEQFGESNRWYLVMDYISGTTLERYLQSKTRRVLPLPELLEVATQLCNVLEYLHTRRPPVIFRDLKPTNIMRTPEGHIYLIDFGIARHFKPGQLKDTASIGSVGYASPEQFGHMQTSPRADIYSLGVILHQMLTGNDPVRVSPHIAPMPRSNQPSLQRLTLLITQMLEMNSHKRPENAAVVKIALQQIALQLAQEQSGRFFAQDTQSTQAQPTGSFQLPPRPNARDFKPIHPLLSSAPTPVLPVSITPPETSRRITGLPKPELKAVLNTLYRGHNGLVETLSWSPRSQRIASGSRDNTILIWDSITGNTIFTFRAHQIVFCLAWSPDENILVSGGYDHTVHIWDISQNRRLFTSRKHSVYRGHQGAVRTVSWSPASNAVASGSSDKSVQVWNPATHSRIVTYNEHQGQINALAWSPDGKRIASASEDHNIHVWSVSTGQKLLLFHAHYNAVKTLAWSPNGRYLASGSLDKTIHVWEARTGQIITTYRRHKGEITGVSWSPDSQMIASSSHDKTVQIWDAMTSKTLLNYSEHDNIVKTLAWSPDQTHIASGGGQEEDKSYAIQVWSVSQ